MRGVHIEKRRFLFMRMGLVFSQHKKMRVGILACLALLLLLLSHEPQPALGAITATSFIPPTDPDGATISRDWTEVAVSVSSDADTASFMDWSGSLVGYWDFNDGTASDKSTHNNNGALINGPLQVLGRFGNALQFDGVDDYADFGGCSANLPLTAYPTTQISITAWIKLGGSFNSRGRILGAPGETADFIVWSDRKLRAGVRTSSPTANAYGNTVLSTGQWYFVAMTYDGSKIEVFVNGVSDGTAPQSGLIYGPGSAYQIGGYVYRCTTDYGLKFNGAIDEVTLWNRALTLQEIKALYNTNTNPLFRTFAGLADGSYQYYAYATDASGAAARTETRTLVVNLGQTPVNFAPVMSPIGNKAADEGSTLSFTVSAVDSDGDSLAYSASNLPPGASFNAATRAFSWSPGYSQAGAYSNVCFSVSDGSLTDSECILITVNDAAPPATPAGDYLLFTQSELTDLKGRTNEASFMAMKAWADAHVNDPSPGDFSSLLTANVSAGSTSFTVASGSKFRAGRWYQIQQLTYGTGTGNQAIHQETFSPSSVVGNTVYLSSGLRYDYNTLGHARMTTDWGASTYGVFQVADSIRRFLTTMTVTYLITGDARYANAAVTWLDDMATWDTWNDYSHRMFQAPARIYLGVAIAYDGLNDYMTSAQRDAIRLKIRKEVSHDLINDYADPVTSNLAANANSGQKSVTVANGALFKVGQYVYVWASWSKYEQNFIAGINGNVLTMENNLANSYATAEGARVRTTDDGNQWYMASPTPNQKANIAGAVGMMALALGNDAPAFWTTHAQYYLNMVFADLEKDAAYNGAAPDGSWFEGEHYYKYGMDALWHYIDALKRSGGADYTQLQYDQLSNSARWHIYMTYNARGIAMGDASWSVGLNTASPMELPFMYGLAKAYSDGYAQKYADLYADKSIPESFIWRDPNLAALDLTGLPLTAKFNNGYVFWKSNWTTDGTDNGVLVVFKDATSKTHAHPSSGEFQVYYKGKPITGAATYLLDRWYIMWAFNIFTEGDSFSFQGETFPGYHQIKETGDFGTTYPPDADGYHGKIEDYATYSYSGSPVFYYVRGNQTPSGNPLYNPYTGDETNSILGYRTAKITGWIRHLFYLPELKALVVGDALSSNKAGGAKFNLQYTVMNNGGSEAITINGLGSSQAITGTDTATIVKNGGAVTPSSVTSKVVMVDPPAAEATRLAVYDNGNGEISPWMYLKISNSNRASNEVFTNVVFPDAADLKPVVRVAQGNSNGVIISNGNQKYLVMFSTDGNPVDQFIELGGYYQAADGNTYSFNGTRVRAQFNRYAVLRLRESTGQQQGNQAPVLSPIGSKVVAEGQLLAFAVSGSDADGDVLSYSVSGLPSGASFDSQTQDFSWVPGYERSGIYVVRFEVSDGELIGYENITITVNNAEQSSSSADTASSSGGGSGGGGGGGGGGGSTLISENSLLQRQLKAGENATFVFGKSAILAVYEITTTALSAASNPSITVKELRIGLSTPALLSEDEGGVYKYVSIQKSAIDNVGQTRISFKVPNEWYVNNNLDPSTTVLNRFVSNEWMKLQTRQVGSDSGYLSFEAVSDGFSIFAVTAEKSQASSAPAVQEKRPVFKGQREVEPAPVAVAPARQAIVAEKERKAFGFIVRILLVAVLVAAAALGMLMVVRRVKRQRSIQSPLQP